jgi:acid phosphatase (class A)
MKSTLLALTLLIGLGLTPTSQAGRGEVMSGQEIKKLIGLYPSKGSVEEKKDFAEMLDLQKSRTDAECAAASKEASASFQNLFAGVNGPLSNDEIRHAFPKIEVAYALAIETSSFAKSLFNRPRPYLTNKTIKPCVHLESSTAYPSGHATISRVVAIALGELYPERAELLFKRADDIAFHRVLGGVHHPSDIAAGKKLGDAVAKRVGLKLDFL